MYIKINYLYQDKVETALLEYPDIDQMEEWLGQDREGVYQQIEEFLFVELDLLEQPQILVMVTRPDTKEDLKNIMLHKLNKNKYE